MIEKGFNQAGRGAPRPLTCAVRIGCLEVAPSDSKAQLIWTCMESKIVLSQLYHNSNILRSNFEMMPPGRRRPIVGLNQDPSHLATPFIGAPDLGVFLTPWQTIPCL